MFKKTLLTTAAVAMLSSAAMADDMSVRQQAWEGIKGAFSTSVDAADDYVIDPVVGGAKGVGLGVATGASVAGSAIADGAVATGNKIAKEAGQAVEYSATGHIWSNLDGDHGEGAMRIVNGAASFYGAILLTPVTLAWDIVTAPVKMLIK